MNICCFYEEIPGRVKSDEFLMIDLWKTIWRKMGFTPIILGIDDAKANPFYEQYLSRVMLYPTSNYKYYELCCWVRWLAMAMQKGETIIMSDYDVFPRCFKQPTSDYMVGYSLGCPCLVSGTPYQFDLICRHFANPSSFSSADYATVMGGPHFSDQLAFGKTNLPFIKLENVCRNVDEKESNNSEAIHCSTEAMQAIGFPNRSEAIPKILELLKHDKRQESFPDLAD